MLRATGCRLVAVATALAFAVVACSATTTMRYRVPLDGPQGAAAKACVNQCLVDHSDRAKRLECWRGCPGAEVEEDQTCGVADRGPEVACEEYEATSAGGAGRILGVALMLVIGVGVVILMVGVSDVIDGEE